MKKYLTIFLAAAIALSLCACDKADNDSESNVESGSGVSSSTSSLISGESTTDTSTGQASSENTSTEQNAPVGGDNTQNVPKENGRLTLLCSGNNFMESGCGTEDGYYSLHYDINGDGLLRVTYVDYASGQEVMLCSDSSCKHDSERCASVLGNDMRYFGEIFFYNERLYYLNVSFFDDNGYQTGSVDEQEFLTDEKRRTELYGMNPDGTGRELVYAFTEGETIEHIAVGDGNCIWFITKENTVEYDKERDITRIVPKNRSLVRLDLSERKIVEQIPIYDSDNIDKKFKGVCGSRFIFSGVAYPGGKSVMDYADELGMNNDPWSGISQADAAKFNKFMSNCEYVYFALDVGDKSMREIYRANYDDAYSGFCHDNSLYVTAADNSTTRLDVNTGKSEAVSAPEGYNLGEFIGDRPVYTVDDGTYREYSADPDTGELTAMTDVQRLLAVSGSRALVVYDTAGTPDPNGGGLLNAYDVYALITLDDLYNGRDNFEPVKMIERI